MSTCFTDKHYNIHLSFLYVTRKHEDEDVNIFFESSSILTLKIMRTLNYVVVSYVARLTSQKGHNGVYVINQVTSDLLYTNT